MRLPLIQPIKKLMLLVAVTFPGMITADSVILQLPWFHQFQFAGYYAAEAQGFFAEEGIEVDIRAGVDEQGQNINPVEEVVFQRAQFGVTRSDLLVHHARGLPVVMLATIMQRTPAAFITLEKYGISRLEDIQQQPVSLPLFADKPSAMIDVEIVTTLARAGIDINQLNNRSPDWNLTELQSGKTQMLLGFATDEPYILEKRGFKPVVISPMDYGIDLYGDLLFTSESTLRSNPDLIERFRKATLRGWEFALKYPETTARYILLNYPVRSADYDLNFMLQEARKMRNYIQADLIEIGYSNRARWKRILNVYREVGINDPVDLDTFIYTPSRHVTHAWWSWPALIFCGFLLMMVGWLIWTRLHLVRIVKHGEQRESQLRRQAETDPLTGLVNRRRFSLELDVSFLRSRQEKSPLSMLMLDVDHFKIVNDEYGHLAGDSVLCSLSRICQNVTRDTDVLCRYGGEEFAFLLPDTSLDNAEEIAERLMQAVRQDVVEWETRPIRYTVSIGVAELNPTDAEGIDLLQRTDRHLYRAKATGRDTISSEPTGRLALVKDA